MTIQGEVKEATVTQSKLARALGISKQRVGQLIDEGIVVRDEFSSNGQVMLFESLQNFFLSKNANLGDGENSVNFWRERGLHEKAKRELAEVKLAKTRGELYEATVVENAFIEMLSILRTHLLGLPAKMAPQLEGENRATIHDVLAAEIEEKLREMSVYNPDAYRSNVDLTAESD